MELASSLASLAASGLTNKQIAERVFVSHRTVAGHLHRVFPILGMATRAALRDASATCRNPSRSIKVRYRRFDRRSSKSGFKLRAENSDRAFHVGTGCGSRAPKRTAVRALRLTTTALSYSGDRASALSPSLTNA
jgi:hypothetical protein